MLEAFAAMLIGGALARAVVWPLNIRQQEARQEREWAAAKARVEEIKRRAREAAREAAADA